LRIEDFVTNGKSIIIKLSPSNQALNEEVVTPNSLKSLIAEIYREIPNKYYSTPHKLIGNYQEFYKDTSNNINANINSKIEVIKDSYRNKNKKGVVKIKEYNRDISDSSKFEHLIGAGPHIPHRFDFVMRRDEFINPDKFNQYKYTFIKEVMYKNRLLDVIKFEPKKSIFGSSFYGKIFIDSKEKVFLKAEYNYTNYGFLVNRHSNWAKRRKFITEYKKQNGMWHLYYTWDEAVSRNKDFKLTQEFYTNTISLDTLQSLKVIDKINYRDVFLLKEDTISINNNISKEEIVNRLMKQNKTLKILSKAEFSYGIKFLQIPSQKFTLSNNIGFEGSPKTVSSNFRNFTFEPALSFNISYKIEKKWQLNYSSAQNFRKDWKIEIHDFGLSKRFELKTERPLSLNLGLSYQSTKNTFSFPKINGFTPKYEKKYSGLNGSLKLELALDSRKQFYIGYNYTYQLSEKDKFYLERKHGFLNLKKDKRNYDLNNINLQVDGVSTTNFPDVFISSSFDLGLTWSFGF
jgi:hypothetical protein